MKVNSSNPVQNAVMVIAIVVGVAALGFGFLLPYQVNNVGGTQIDKSCVQPFIEVFRDEIDNPTYMKYGPSDSSFSAEIANLGGPRIRNVWCQDAAALRMTYVGIALALSMFAVVISRKVST